MNRRQFLATVGASGTVNVAGCSSDGTETTDDTVDADGTAGADGPLTRVGPSGFERRRGDGTYSPVPVRGVNLGMAKPGYFPGSAAITRAEYDRWLSQVGEIANVVRTYTIHPPAFYRALAAYNERSDSPLYLLQGTWVPEEPLVEAGDASERSEAVDRELRRTVDVVNGDATLPERRGHASGTYDADVHDALFGYLFGIEWPPKVVVATNEAAAAGTYTGTYLTSDGTGFERWLAERLDGVVRHADETYGTQAPVGFVNWVTTDPLDHPYEPFPGEDRVGVDPDAVAATDAFDAGTYAAYHVYPYYPDFLNETPSYVDYVDHRGEPNSYAGYLNDLVGATEHPLLVAEFGVPSSRGIAHRDVHGRDQGRHTERRQGEIVAAMYEDIVREGAAGGVAFSWQDEWFKRTWNLDARSVPGRRPYWSNVETPEQRFGLLAFDPVDATTLSGDDTEWSGAMAVEPERRSSVPSLRALTDLRVSHSAEGLELRVTLAGDGPVDWDRVNVLLAVGLRGRETALPFDTDATAEADFMVRLGGPSASRVLVHSSYDAFAREFGSEAGLPLDAYRDGTAGYVSLREPINRGYTVPPTGETVPFEAVEAGRLRYGTGDPDAEAYDSLTDVHVDPTARTVEVRLPWVLINVADPSSKRRIASAWEAGLETVDFETVAVGAATYAPTADGRAATTSGETNLVHAAPGTADGRLSTATYGWERWNQPEYAERRKRAYDVLQDRWGERP